MLKALLHRKLGRGGNGSDDDETEHLTRDWITNREDLLTASIFERFAYLEPTEAWGLLRAASVGTRGELLPDAAPSGKPEWWFWPRLSPGEGGEHERSVEPDVVVRWNDFVLIIEAKHYGEQYAAQWVRQIHAVRADPRFAVDHMALIAAGGALHDTFATRVAEAQALLGTGGLPLLLLRWEELHHVVEARQRHLTGPGAIAILDDIIASLQAWGYQRRVRFDSLPAVARPLSISTTPTDLGKWRVS